MAPKKVFSKPVLPASEEEKASGKLRVCKHEASHLLCAYVLGLPIQEVTVNAAGKGPQVVVYDEELATQPGQLVREVTLLPRERACELPDVHCILAAALLGRSRPRAPRAAAPAGGLQVVRRACS